MPTNYEISDTLVDLLSSAIDSAGVADIDPSSRPDDLGNYGSNLSLAIKAFVQEAIKEALVLYAEESSEE